METKNVSHDAELKKHRQEIRRIKGFETITDQAADQLNEQIKELSLIISAIVLRQQKAKKSE